MTVLFDPTNERLAARHAPAPRPASLAGLTIGLLDISKPRGDVFLDELGALLRQRGLHVERYRKPTFAKPAPADVRREIAARCQLIVEALAD
jgi:hypothetical protein